MNKMIKEMLSDSPMWFSGQTARDQVAELMEQYAVQQTAEITQLHHDAQQQIMELEEQLKKANTSVIPNSSCFGYKENIKRITDNTAENYNFLTPREAARMAIDYAAEQVRESLKFNHTQDYINNWLISLGLIPDQEGIK